MTAAAPAPRTAPIELPAPRAAAAAPAAAPPAARGCLPAGNGYLRARIRGALNLDLDWHDADIACAGGPRPDSSGIRLSFAGPRRADGRRLRLVFGVAAVREGRSGRALPTNLTVIVEGARQLFTTRGEDHCTVDALRQERLGARGSGPRAYRVVARGFCISPASTINNSERILVSRFDFAGNAVFGADPDKPL
ncbi:MAG TPA: hypothetical protein VFK87_06135 [Steroidobacteraceae bacterium]|nr:hypothetical protein [Steroidobacteraceae bacterium]